MSSIPENIESLKKELPENVLLVAVSKTKPIEDVQMAYNAGQRDFGENRIQEMAEKAEALPKDIRWHAIGHLQGNKLKYLSEFVHLVHGIDKAKRLKELNKEAQKSDRNIGCLLQIHIATEDSKFGFSYEEANEILDQDLLQKYPNLKIRGLMGMATFIKNREQIRNEFRGLSQFFQKIREKKKLPDFEVLSMGMSGDWEIAVEEGATLVRVGSAIFGKRD